MKAKRRHELEQNDLSKAIVRLPTFFEMYGNQILIAIIVVCAAVIIFRWQWNRRADRAMISADSLATARQSLTDLAALADRYGGDYTQIAGARSQLITDIRVAIDGVEQNTTDRTLLAEALVERGDLNWIIANLPELPGATTRPVLRLDQTPAESLDNAQKAYTQVLDQYPDQNLSVISSRFGLAAIAENQHAWDKAEQQYKAIEDNQTAAQGFKDQAKMRLQLLAQIQKPAYIATPTTQPTTAP